MTLAHGGVLFLDELGQFPQQVLDGLREALEPDRSDMHRNTIKPPRREESHLLLDPLPRRFLDGDWRVRGRNVLVAESQILR